MNGSLSLSLGKYCEELCQYVNVGLTNCRQWNFLYVLCSVHFLGCQTVMFLTFSEITSILLTGRAVNMSSHLIKNMVDKNFNGLTAS